jgi:hypothetical protein
MPWREWAMWIDCIFVLHFFASFNNVLFNVVKIFTTTVQPDSTKSHYYRYSTQRDNLCHLKVHLLCMYIFYVCTYIFYVCTYSNGLSFSKVVFVVLQRFKFSKPFIATILCPFERPNPTYRWVELGLTEQVIGNEMGTYSQ